MTDFAALDPTRLRNMLDAVLAVLVDAADGAGWVPDETAVTLVSPGYGCDSIYVWAQSITPDPDPQLPCVVVPVVSVRWAVALCVGSDLNESAAWWRDRVGQLDPLWGVVAGLYASVADRTLVTALNVAAGIGTDCMSVQLGRADRFDSADVFVWEGTLNVHMST